MNFIDKLLQPGEEIVFRTRLHPMVFIKPVVLAVFIAFLGIILPEVYLPYVGALFVVLLVPYTALMAFSLKIGEVAVTNRRVIIRTGPLQNQMHEVLLHKLREVSVSGRSVNMEMAGMMTRSVAFTREPGPLAEAIERARKRMQQNPR